MVDHLPPVATFVAEKIFVEAEVFFVHLKPFQTLCSVLASLKFPVVALLIFLRHTWRSVLWQRLTRNGMVM